MPNPILSGVTLLNMIGEPTGPAKKLMEHQRIGVDGASYEWVFTNADPFTIGIESDVANANAGHAFFRWGESLVGNLVSLTTPNGATYNNLLVLQFLPGESRRIGPYVGGVYAGSTYFVTATVQLRYIYGY